MEPRPARRSIRYQGYNYRQAGYYALTVCAAAKACLFGDFSSSLEADAAPVLLPSALGEVVVAELLALPAHFPALQLDEWILMPNHLHFILVIRRHGVISVGEVVGQFKSRCYKVWRQCCQQQGQAIPLSPWQRNYYERIIRNAAELEQQRHYIRTNPARR